MIREVLFRRWFLEGCQSYRFCEMQEAFQHSSDDNWTLDSKIPLQVVSSILKHALTSDSKVLKYSHKIKNVYEVFYLVRQDAVLSKKTINSRTELGFVSKCGRSRDAFGRWKKQFKERGATQKSPFDTLRHLISQKKKKVQKRTLKAAVTYF